MGLKDNIQKVTLDFNNPNIKTLRFVQYDKDARKITVTFTDCGKTVPIDAATTEVYIKWLKPDGYPVFNDGIINADGTVTITCTEQMLIADGVGHAQVMLLEKSTEKVLHSMPVKAVIQKSVYCHCKLTSTAEFDALVHILLKIREAERIIEKFPEWEAAENARKQAELERERAEAEREKNTAAAIANANKAADNANTAAAKANTATINANNAANKANIAAANADAAAKKANDAAINADDAADNANQATNNANDAINKVNDKIAQAQDVINDARQAISDINNTEQAVQNAESDRVAAEIQRQKDFDKKMNDADQKINDMNQLIDDCSDALNNANNAIIRAEQANDTADETIEKLQNALDSIKEYTGNQPIVSVTQPENQDIGDIWFVETERN